MFDYKKVVKAQVGRKSLKGSKKLAPTKLMARLIDPNV
jgi:hypothetical protein